MENDDFNAGKIVTLKSGGAKMTVRTTVSYDEALNLRGSIDPGVHCDWQDKKGRPHRSVFKPEQLAIESN